MARPGRLDLQSLRMRERGVFQWLGAVAALVLAGAQSAQAETDPYTQIDDVPTPSLYGGMGLLDMHNARFMPDGYISVDATVKKPDNRVVLTFQALPWLETSFRYSINYALPPEGQRALYDRSFDLKFRLEQEGVYTPEVALGLQDFIGTGVYSAEYLVASKRLGPLDVTMGMGWGRLASRPAFPNPLGYIYSSFFTRPGFGNSGIGGRGGVPLFTSYFRGPNVGLFGGVEYQTPIPKLKLKVEYSSDAYTKESTNRSETTGRLTNYAPIPFNVGLSYRFWSNVDLGVAYMNGKELSFQVAISLNPTEPNWPARMDPMPPFVSRPAGSVQSALTQMQIASTETGADDPWRIHLTNLSSRPALDGRPPDPALFHLAAAPPAQQAASPQPTAADLLEKMRHSVEDQGLSVDGIAVRRNVVKIEIENQQYLRDAEAFSRSLRALSGTAPASIEAFEVTTASAHMPISTLTIPRSQIDALGQQTGTPAELWASTMLSDAKPSTRYGPILDYPNFSWSVFPGVREDLFDPNNPVYVGVGISGSTHVELLPGLTIDDQGTYGLWNDFGSITRGSNSVLPHVRSDVTLYLQKGFTGIDYLSSSYLWKPAPEVFTRLTAGYIENMFAGAGGEMLYRPFGQRWAVGADVYEVYQRNFNDLFGVQHYHVLTGHATLYVETPWHGVTAIVRAGRYLAGDYGGTFEMVRRFDTGVEVGAWFTFTNVPFSKFGEGSFDKGITITIPTEWALPFGSTSSYTLPLRPIQRDGGQPLANDAELYDLTRPSSYGDLESQWPHVFQ